MMKRSSIVCRRLVVLLMIFSALANGEIASTKESENTSISSSDTPSPIDSSRQQPPSPAPPFSAAPSGGAKTTGQIDPQLRKGLEAFFSTGPTTTPEEILAQRPLGYYTDTDREGDPTAPQIFVIYQTLKFDVLEQYMFVEKKFVQGVTSILSHVDKTPAQQFAAYALQELATRGVCTKMSQRPKEDASPPDILLDWKCGEAVFILFLGISQKPDGKEPRYRAILGKAETTEEPQHMREDLQGMEALTEPAAALAAWGISMPEGWRPGKDMQETKEID